jgi:hypothetical protein
MNFKKLIKMVLVGAGIVFIALIAMDWENFKAGLNGVVCCPKTSEK